MTNETPVANDILQIAYQAYLEEHNGIDGFPATFIIIRSGEFIQKLKVDGTFQPSVKSCPWELCRQDERS